MKRVAYIVEDVNFVGGGHVATANLIRELNRRGYAIDVVGTGSPTEATRERFGQPVFHRVDNKVHSFGWNVRRLVQKTLHLSWCPAWTVDPTDKMRRLLSKYDCVCVASENSCYRQLVAGLPKSVRKVQMIHCDYFNWARSTPDTRCTTRCDRWIYRKMDAIALVSEANAVRFRAHYPEMAGKVVSFANVIPIPKNGEQARRVDDNRIRIVTAARFEDTAKAITRTVRLAIRLVNDGLPIDWTFYGTGPKWEGLREEVNRQDEASRHIHLSGVCDNFSEVISNYDIMILLSHSEGLPMTIYEALIAGVPVAATRVGGIPEQVEDGKNGWLFEDRDEDIYSGLKRLLSSRETIATAHENLKAYTYDNDGIINNHIKILGLG